MIERTNHIVSKPLTATSLHILAMLSMLLDHICHLTAPRFLWLTFIGRIAFPIFCFLLVEGFYHTKNLSRYLLRLFGFAIISEIPFDLFQSHTLIDISHQNVMFTLFLGLCVIIVLHRASVSHQIWRRAILTIVAIVLCIIAELGKCDYGAMGVLSCVVFYLFHDMPYCWAPQLIAMIGLNQIFHKGPSISLFGLDLQIQAFAVLALVPICLYNGEKGKSSKIFQYGCYCFYPVHQLLLAILQTTFP